LLQSEIYFIEKRRVRRICNRDIVTYVTYYILNATNKNLPPSLAIPFLELLMGKVLC
jgi:hypothetical protein